MSKVSREILAFVTKIVPVTRGAPSGVPSSIALGPCKEPSGIGPLDDPGRPARAGRRRRASRTHSNPLVGIGCALPSKPCLQDQLLTELTMIARWCKGVKRNGSW
jgi:hypothetical protein